MSRFGPTPKKVRKFLEKHYNPESPNNEIIREGILRRAKAMQFGAIVSFDYNQIELRVLAALSGDKTMQRIYLEGGDIHLETTLHTFQLNREEYDRADPNEKIRMRTVSKKLNFSASYGSSGHGVRSMLAREDPPIYISERDADRFVARHWAKYKGMARWSQQTIREIRKTKKAVSEFGRVRRLPEIHSSSEKAVAEAERQGVNDKIQSVASDITLTATVVITQRLEENGLRSKVWLVVHDSIILDCPIEEIEIAVEIAESTMTNLPRYARKFLGKDFSWDFMGPIPLTVKGEIGPNYRDLEAFSSPKDAIPAFAKAVVAARKRDRQDERLTDVEKIKV